MREWMKKQEYPSCVIFFASSSTRWTELQKMMLWFTWSCVCVCVLGGGGGKRVYSSVHVAYL